MRLESRNGAFVELHPVRDGDESLLVDGVVNARDGRVWTFRAARLSRDEARRLGNWLLRAAKGRLEPHDRLTFAAPELTFTLDEHEYGQPRVLAGFSLGAAPSWLGDEQSRTYDYPVTLDLTPESLESAAVHWERELSA